jgi:hypothetical protein
VKKKRFSAILGVVLAFVLLIGLTLPLAGAAGAYTIEFLNPLGRVEPQDNQPLTERVPWLLDADGHLTETKVVMRIQYDTTSTGDALAMMLMDEFGRYGQYYPNAGIVYVTSAFSGNWGPKTELNYNTNWVVGGTGVSVSNLTGYSMAPLTGTYQPSNANYRGKIDVALGGIAN